MTDRDLRKLINGLTDSIRGLREQIESATKYQQSHKKTDKHQPLEVSVTCIPELDPTRSKYYEAENAERKRFWVKHKPKFEVAGIAIALALAFFNWRVLTEIQKQTPKISDSADAATSAAGTAAKQLELAERPWLSMSAVATSPLHFGSNGFTLALSATVNNYGHSPATRVEFAPELFVISSATVWAERDRLCESLLPRRTFGSDRVPLWQVIMPNTPSTHNISFDTGMANVNNYLARDRSGGARFVPLAAIACVAYSSTFDEKSRYYTGVYYSILRNDPRSPNRPVFVNAEQTVPLSDLLLIQDEYSVSIR